MEEKIFITQGDFDSKSLNDIRKERDELEVKINNLIGQFVIKNPSVAEVYFEPINKSTISYKVRVKIKY